MTRSRWMGKAVLAWEEAHTSLWFTPAVLVFLAVGLSSALLRLDDALGTGYAGGWWLFGGSASGARTVLSVIAGSLITVVAVAFSVTMIAIQQASTQYTPRVLRSFTRDRGNQVVLGTYIATFAYALLVLRRVRESGGDASEFVPAIAISTGMFLALVSLGMLVFFIHHVAEALQVTTLLAAVRRELDKELERVFPEALGRAGASPSGFGAGDADGAFEAEGHEVVVSCDEEGYLRRIDEGQLVAAVAGRARFVRVGVQLGDYLRPGDVLLRAWTDDAPGEAFSERLREVFQVARERSLHQDPLYGIRLLVDIGVKALSPGINDPTTAEQTLDQLGGAMVLLLGRAFPSPLRVVGGVRIRFEAPTVGDYIDASFTQLRRAARAELHVSVHLLGVLRMLLERTTTEERAAPLRGQIAEVYAGFDQGVLTDREREALRRAVGRADPSRGVGA